MSWQAYSNQITEQGIQHAALYSLENGAEWAKSTDNPGTCADAQKLIQHLNTTSTERVEYGGKKYITLRNSGDVLYGKLGGGGITVAKTAKAIIVGVYDDSCQPGQCNKVVERMQAYLIENGF